MAKKSYDECYYKKTDSIEYLDDITKYVEQNDGNVGKYENSMFCAECRKAELSYVHKTTNKRAFLRRKSSTSHIYTCSYNYEYSSNEYSQEYYKTLRPEQIKDRMNSMMRKLFQENNVFQHKMNNISEFNESESPFIQEKEHAGNHVRKSLRRKNLGKWLDKEIANQLHLFYGKVQLKVREYSKINNEGKKYTYHFIDVYCENKKGEWKKRTQIYRGTVKEDINEEALYHFVAVGTMNFSNGYPKLELSNKDSILFKIIE